MDKNAIIKKDVNIGLLILIVATLIMFTSFTVYYNSTFKNISNSYDKKLEELKQVTEDLKVKRTLLNQTSQQLDLNEKKVEEFDVKFTEVRGDRDKFEAESTKLGNELSIKSGQLDQAYTDLEAKQAALDEANKNYIIAAQLNVNLQEEIDGLEDEKNEYIAEINCLQGTADADEGNC